MAKLNDAENWMDRAIGLEEKGNSQSIIDKCTSKAIELEREGLAEGETY